MKQIGKSIRDKLFNLAKDQGVNYQYLLIHFFHERFLCRLSVSSYRNNFYLKGGALLYALNTGEKQRYTLDIDFSVHQMDYKSENIAEALLEICKIPVNDGVEFDGSSLNTMLIKENDVYGGIRISIEARLDTIRQRLQIDIGYGDPVYPNHHVITIPALIEEMTSPTVLVYTLESVIAEKFHAMIELSGLNSRLKDFYDVHQLLSSGNIEAAILKEAIVATFNNRRTYFVHNHALFTPDFAADYSRNRMWQAFLKKIGQAGQLPFPQVMAEIKTVLQPVWESLNSENT